MFTMIWLMVLVILGTLAQKDYGLYKAQQWFFSPWITWLGPFPFPGAKLTLVAMFVNVLCFTLKTSFWSFKKIGIVTTHLGVLLLLFGAGLTAWFSSEGSMIIKEGDSSNFISDYHDKEFAIINKDEDGIENIITISQDLFKKGKIIESEDIPFKIKIIDYYTNANMIRRDQYFEENYKGLAKNFAIIELEDNIEPNLNQSAINFEIFDSNQESNGFYSLLLEQTIPQKIRTDEDIFTLILQRKKTYLPFQIKLSDFKKVLHPGTNIAKSYSSDVYLKDEGTSRRVLIQMNQPLRYRNYTFYQSSFIEGFDKDTTVLAVVKNYGRLFPYISSLIMATGLLLHMIIRLPNIFKARKRKSG